MDIHVKQPRPSDAIILPNHINRDRYDQEVAQDHTGLKMRAVSKRNRRGALANNPTYDPAVLMEKPTYLECPGKDGRCKSKAFRIIADNSRHAAGGLLQFECASGGCGQVFPIFQIGEPQMTDDLMRRLGLPVPESDLAFDFTLDS